MINRLLFKLFLIPFLASFGVYAYECGDCSGDGRVTAGDAVYLTAYLYRFGPEPCGEADANSDGRVTVADAAFLINYLYRNGPVPCEWEGMIIDHLCTDLTQVPSEFIDSAKTWNFYYLHTSHGGQICPDGLTNLESTDSTYAVSIGDGYLPLTEGEFCVYDRGGDPKDYWWGDEWRNGPTITRDALNAHPLINITAFCWCTQMNYEGTAYVESYLDSMSMLESEFPNVTFVYMTGNAQADQERGWNRYQRNEEIRQYCIQNDKILFDFAEIDSWWFDPDTQEWEQATTSYDGHTFPVQHPRYEGDECGHAKTSLCEQKAKAFWWLLARLSGW